MSENVIFCYSGTGNCLDMAKTIARELGDTDIILMRKEPAVTDVRDAKRVGFVFPCYGGGLPGGVEESLCKIQVGLTAYTFGVCQYAGYMGSGLYKLNSIIPLRYWTAVSHQCTCIWLLPHSVMLPPVTPIGAMTMRFLSSMRPILIGRDRIEGIITSYSLDHFCTAQPPSTGRQTPLMYLASSEHRYTTAQAASSGMPT